MMYETVMALRRVGLFQGLEPLQITEIMRRCERVAFSAGQEIIAEGETGDAAFLILSGPAERVSGPELADGPHPIRLGSLVGEMAMFVETEHSSTVVATGSVRTLKIARAALHAQMGDDPALAEHFVAAIVGRLNVAADALRQAERALASDDDMPAGGYCLPAPALSASGEAGVSWQH
ncbi:MAG: cyclic nucleotide-binding domain-containing protein [Hyphomicrobiaceae bacterium]